jgi:hypothetical protein
VDAAQYWYDPDRFDYILYHPDPSIMLWFIAAEGHPTHPEAFLPSKYLPLKPPGRSLAGLGPLGSLE